MHLLGLGMKGEGRGMFKFGRDWCLHHFSDLHFEIYYIKFGKESNYRVYKQSS